MENYSEKEPSFKIELPTEGDEVALAPMHIQAWKDAYIVPESGLTEEKIDELLQHLLTNTEFRRNTINEALANPDKVLYRVVKNEAGEIVGFLHGTKHEDHNELDAIYLLNEAKGTGTGGKLMEEFLSWIDKDKIARLEAFAFNESAIQFYERYGFEKTDAEMDLFKEMSVIEMVRRTEEAQ